jgi:hypothetical protein
MKKTYQTVALSLAIVSVVFGYIISHHFVFVTPGSENFDELFISKMNGIEGYLLGIFFLLVAHYFKRND